MVAMLLISIWEVKTDRSLELIQKQNKLKKTKNKADHS